MTHLRLYWQVLGGHVHCRLFSGPAPDLTHGKNGDLVFSLDEWRDGVREAFARYMELRHESEGDRQE